MYRSVFYKASIDGIISGIILNTILDFALSSCAKDFSAFVLIQLGVISAILVSVFFYLLIMQIKTFKAILLFGIISTILFALTIALYYILPVDLFSTRETVTGDGILILAIAGIYFFLSLILKSSFALIGIIGGRFRSTGSTN